MTPSLANNCISHENSILSNNSADSNLLVKTINKNEPLNFTNYNLDELISSQKINPEELNNIGIVGQGHGGIVYKLVNDSQQSL